MTGMTGTQDHRVLVWDMPAKAEVDRQVTGSLSYLEPAINPAERKARIWARLTNTGDLRLYEGDTVTLVIPQP